MSDRPWFLRLGEDSVLPITIAERVDLWPHIREAIKDPASQKRLLTALVNDGNNEAFLRQCVVSTTWMSDLVVCIVGGLDGTTEPAPWFSPEFARSAITAIDAAIMGETWLSTEDRDGVREEVAGRLLDVWDDQIEIGDVWRAALRAAGWPVGPDNGGAE